MYGDRAGSDRKVDCGKNLRQCRSRRELHFLKAGRGHGLFLAQLGAQVGVGKQGVVDRIDRLEALLRYDRPDEKITRSARRSEHEARERSPAQAAWLDAHREELVSVITGPVGEEELALDVRDNELTPATIVILGLAAAEIRTAPAVLALDSTRPYAVHTLLTRADDLRSQFTELGTKNIRGSGRTRVRRRARAGSLAWVHAQPAVTSVIIGARRLSQLDENVRAVDVKLTAEELARLNALTEPTFGFPHHVLTLAPSGINGGTTVNGVSAPIPDYVMPKGNQPY